MGVPVLMPLTQSVGIVTYRMRINTSGATESKIIIGDNILRITDNGNNVFGHFTSQKAIRYLSQSSIKLGRGKSTDVTVA